MKTSGNSFAKKTVTEVSAFTDKAVTKGGSFSKKRPTKADKGWEGENTGPGYFGEDLYSGNPFGVGEFGGISHYQRRTKPVITH